MSKFTDLLAELSRNDDCQPCYNGVDIIETEVVYQKRLEALYNDAIGELISTSIDKDIIIKRLKEIQENQSCFYYPSAEEIESRRNEEKHNDSDSLKSETDFLEFVKKCIELQRYYLNRFRAYFTDADVQDERDKEVEVLDVTKTENAKDADDIIKGVKGLAKFLGCCTNTAQNILNKGILQKNGLARMTGRAWRFKKEELADFIKKNPKIFR